MATFQKQKLGELMLKVTDGSHWSPKENLNGIPMASVKDMTEFGFDLDKCKKITKEDYEKIVKSDCKPLVNDILIAKDGSYLKFAFVWKKEIELSILSSIAILRPDTKKINPYYFSKILTMENTKKEMANYVTGSALPRIVLKDFKKMEFEIPDIAFQNRIASVLSPYDNLIENNKMRIKILEEMAQLLYIEWFVKFKFPGHEKVKMVDSKTEYGIVPEGWEVKIFGDSFDVKYGKTLPTSKITESGKYKVYGAGGIIGYYDQKNIDIKTTLVTCRGNGSGTVWRTFGEGFITNNSFTVNGKNKEIGFEFIYSCLKGCNIEGAVTGSAQPQITIESINFVKFTLPPINLITAFINKTRQLYELSDYFLKKNQNLSQTRNLLIPQLVTGKRELK